MHKKALHLCAGLLWSSCTLAQTTLWSEDFDGNGGAGSNWQTAPLNISIGGQGPNANVYYISDAENGNAIGDCGSAGGGDQTLHMGSTTLGDLGAAYDAGCTLPGCALCGSFPIVCSDTQTDKRSISNNISTVGYGTLTLEYGYLEGGELAIDNSITEWSSDGGASWNTLNDPAKTPIPPLCAPQGEWTFISTPLPAGAENIPNLKIAFHWVNDANSSGNDPSFAVDDIVVKYATVLPVELADFGVKLKDGIVDCEWTTTTETNSSHFIVERSNDNASWESIGSVPAAGNSTQTRHYDFYDPAPYKGNTYYRLVKYDLDGKSATSQTEVVYWQELTNVEMYPNPATDNLHIHFANSYSGIDIDIYNLAGEVMRSYRYSSVYEHLDLDLGRLPPGIYLVRINTPDHQSTVERLVIR